MVRSRCPQLEADRFVIKRAPFRDHPVITVSDTLHQRVRTSEAAIDQSSADWRTAMRTGAMTCGESLHHTGRMSARGRALCVMTAEELLVSKLRSRDEEAFHVVVTEQHDALIRMAMRYVANRETAEEVVQETWIAMIQGLNRFEGRSSLHAWIRAILIHKAKDRGVREKRQITFSDFGYETDDRRCPIDPSRYQHGTDWLKCSTFSFCCWEDRTPEALLASQQAVVCIQQAIAGLPAPLKEALILRDVHGVETDEVCNKLNISQANLYVRLHRARERVRMVVETVLG